MLHPAILLGVVVLLALQGCALFVQDDIPEITCPDLTGIWTSATFNPLKVFADGTHETQADTVTTFEVVYQDGCQFQGINSWSSGTLGGSEPVVGTVSQETGLITIVEIGPHPVGGSSAIIVGNLIGADQMTWEYVGLADDDTMGQAFITSLHKGTTPPERAGCPDLRGTWTSEVFNPLKVFADGSRETQADTTTTLEIVYQEGCQFQAVNSWASGSLGGSEHAIGVISGETGLLTISEVGPHPIGGSSALIFASLVGSNQMTWEYIGLADDDTMGQVFITSLHKGSTPPGRVDCPDITGVWNSTVFNPLNVFVDGTRQTLSDSSSVFEVVYQEGCQFQGVNSWSNGQRNGIEHVAGTISGETGMISIVEIGDHLDGGSSALILGRLISAGVMMWEYVGLSDDDTMGQVFITELIQQ